MASSSSFLDVDRTAICARPASSAGHPASHSFGLTADSAASEHTLRTARSLSPYVPYSTTINGTHSSASLQSLHALASTNAAMFGNNNSLKPIAQHQTSHSYGGHSRNVSSSSHLSLPNVGDEMPSRASTPLPNVSNLNPHALQITTAASSHADLLTQAAEEEEDVKPNLSASRLPHCSEPANYGITDEATTTLWDLKDGPEGSKGKPPYPYLLIIRIALLSSEQGKLTLQELYDTLENRWPFFNGEQRGWKNSIRHNLSLNECFKKEARHVLDPGKGSYWYCDLSEPHCTPRIRNRSKKVERPLSGPGSRKIVSKMGLPVKKRKRSGHEHEEDDEDDAMDADYDEYNEVQGLDDGTWKREVKPRLAGRSRAAERAAAQQRDIKLPIPGSAFHMPSVVIDDSHMSIPDSWTSGQAPSGMLVAPFGMPNMGLTLPNGKSTRPRATSAPSPITLNFAQDIAAGHPTINSMMMHEYPDASPYTFPAQIDVTQHALQYKQDMPKRGFSDRHYAENGPQLTHSNANTALSVDVLPFGVPGLVSDSSYSPSTAGTLPLETPKTARSIFHHMLRQNGHVSDTVKEEAAQTKAATVDMPAVKIEQGSGSTSPSQAAASVQVTPSAAYAFPAPSTTSPALSASTSVLEPSASASASQSAMRQYFLQQQHAQSQQGQHRINIPPPTGALQNAPVSNGVPAGLPGAARATTAARPVRPFESLSKGPIVGGMPLNVIPTSARKASIHAKPSAHMKPSFPAAINTGNRHWSPPPSAGFAQSPTRAFHGADYDKMFGGLFADAHPRRISRAGSIFAPMPGVTFVAK